MFENSAGKVIWAHRSGARWKLKRWSNYNHDQAHPAGLRWYLIKWDHGDTEDDFLKGLQLLDEPPYDIIDVPSCNQFKRERDFPDNMIYSEAAKSTRFGPAGSQAIPSIAMLAICLTINALLSQVRAGEGTAAQRGWIISWFISNTIFGDFIELWAVRYFSDRLQIMPRLVKQFLFEQSAAKKSVHGEPWELQSEVIDQNLVMKFHEFRIYIYGR